MKHMATLRSDTPLRQLFDAHTHSFIREGRRYRALDIVGKDRELLLAISDPKYAVCGITNSSLQNALLESTWANKHTGKALSARISRHLRLFREHGLIRKVPNQRKYMLTDTGRSLVTALPALLDASIQQLTEKAA